MERPKSVQDAFDICQSLLKQLFHLSHDSPLGEHPLDKQGTTLDSVAHALNELIETCDTNDKGDVAYGIQQGMILLANEQPAYLDKFLQVYIRTVDISYDERMNTDESTLAFLIVMEMTEVSKSFYRTKNLIFNQHMHPGTQDLLDASKLNYTQEEVNDKLDIILKERRIQANEANLCIVGAAMFARFSVLVKERQPQWLRGYGIRPFRLETAFQKIPDGPDGWIKADFLAALIRFRGYAKSVSEQFAANHDTRGKMDEWQELLKRWLYDPELNNTNDGTVKHHVLLALRNLREGPFDETSEELFRPRDWVSC